MLLQWECEIAPDDTVINLYTSRRSIQLRSQSVLEVCDLFRSGNPPHIEQDESQGDL